MEFVLFRNAIMIGVLPKTKQGENAISPIYLTISVTAICISVKLSECKETIFCFPWRRGGLWSEIAKQFGTIIYHAIAVAV
jgi:hypothetical protein